MALILVVSLSALFVLTHFLLSHGGIRRSLVDALGQWPFRGLYSIVSIATLVGAGAVLWTHRGIGPELWRLPGWLVLTLAVPLMLAALVLLVFAFAAPSPASMVPASYEARGMLRITRHPMNVGFACFGLAHMVGNGTLGDACFFAAFVIVGLGGAVHQDRRLAAERGEAMRRFQRETSVLPFAAILSGRNRFEARELSLPVLALSVLLWAGLLLFHGRLFGVPLL